MNKPKEITMMQLRKQPGEWIYYQVFRQAKTLIITHSGKQIAVIKPIEPLIVEQDGSIHGTSHRVRRG